MTIDPRETSHPGDRQLLYHFVGTYECIFNILHPLVRIPGLPGGNPWHRAFFADLSQLNTEALSKELLREIDALPIEEDGRVMVDGDIFEQLEKQSGECVSWKSFGRACGVTSSYSMVRGFYGACTGVGDREIGSIVNAALLKEELYLPMLGGFPFVLENKIVDVLKAFNIDEITMSHELFEDRTVNARVSKFNRELPWYKQTEPNYRGNTGIHRIFDPELKVTFLVDGDSFCSLVCLKHESMKNVIDIPSLFDGFWCDEITTGYWFRRQDVPWN